MLMSFINEENEILILRIENSFFGNCTQNIDNGSLSNSLNFFDIVDININILVNFSSFSENQIGKLFYLEL